LPRRLVVAGIIVTGIGLAMLGYFDPTISTLFLGGTVTEGGASTLSRTATFNVNFTTGPIVFPARGSNSTTSLVSVATMVVFVVAVIGLLLTIAGSFATERSLPGGAGPSPAASAMDGPDRGFGSSQRNPG
jgi:hypothetical protein